MEESRPAPSVELLGPVSDHASILAPAAEQAIAQKLIDLEKATGHQMVVVTVGSLMGREIADYTTDLGGAWGIGRAGVDNGVILLVAPNERRVRIAVGYGLEEVLPDEFCSAVIQNSILPHFRQDDYFSGIAAGTDQLIGRLRDQG
ncbi:TPM domain-containing protein [Erythrobacter aquimaris]|uniref:TPM domain-containing protein n=1 Tax=Qipengyuania aquimaris TaxID=255984 RepID=A0A6I4TLP7_9SPHN|nr:TPM domain-containing protein [Qipengyuania aquimaris]MXO96854.1 TPM domain-containing protein [Qipengyuania aquimaris]